MVWFGIGRRLHVVTDLSNVAVVVRLARSRSKISDSELSREVELEQGAEPAQEVAVVVLP